MPRFVKFLLGGGLGVVAYYVSLYVLTEFVGLWYLASAFVAWALNYGINFTVQKYWTFGDKNKKAVPRQLTLYLAMALSFLIFNSIGLFVLVEYLGWWYLAAQIVLTGVFSITSFVISRRIFRTAPSA